MMEVSPKAKVRRPSTKLKAVPPEDRHIVAARTKELSQILHWRFQNHMSAQEIADLLGKSETAVRTSIEPFKDLFDRAEEITAFRDHEPELLDGIRYLLTKGMTEQLMDEGRRKSLDFSRLSWGFSALFDKTRLARGESTANVKLSLAQLVQEADAQDITDIQNKNNPDPAGV